MPKQRITFTRTETIVVEFDYAVDPFTRANVEFWANNGYCGSSPIGRPGTVETGQKSATEWRLFKSEPPVCVCQEAKPSKAKPRSNPRGK